MDSSEDDASDSENEDAEDIKNKNDSDDDKKIKNEKSSHCHCSLFTVDEDLLAHMSNGLPYQRYLEELKKKRKEKLENERIRENIKADDDIKEKADLKVELQRLRRKIREDMKKKTQLRAPRPVTEASRKEDRIKRKQEIQDQRDAKRLSLALAFDT